MLQTSQNQRLTDLLGNPHKIYHPFKELSSSQHHQFHMSSMSSMSSICPPWKRGIQGLRQLGQVRGPWPAADLLGGAGRVAELLPGVGPGGGRRTARVFKKGTTGATGIHGAWEVQKKVRYWLLGDSWLVFFGGI